MIDSSSEEEKLEGETVLISRRALRERSAEVEALSDAAAQVGAEQVAEGEETLASAREIAAAGRATLAAGVSSVTRGVDALEVSERAALLSETVAAAGVADMAQGAELLAASDDLAVMSAVVAGMSSEDLERGMDLAAIYGELSVVGDVVAALDMPVLAAFLEDRGDWLREIAVDDLLRYGATRALSEAMEETGQEVAGLGSGEVAEGLVRLAASEEMAARSEALA